MPRDDVVGLRGRTGTPVCTSLTQPHDITAHSCAHEQPPSISTSTAPFTPSHPTRRSPDPLAPMRSSTPVTAHRRAYVRGSATADAQTPQHPCVDASLLRVSCMLTV
jgi:hypothetical protein